MDLTSYIGLSLLVPSIMDSGWDTRERGCTSQNSALRWTVPWIFVASAETKKERHEIR